MKVPSQVHSRKWRKVQKSPWSLQSSICVGFTKAKLTSLTSQLMFFSGIRFMLSYDFMLGLFVQVDFCPIDLVSQQN